LSAEKGLLARSVGVCGASDGMRRGTGEAFSKLNHTTAARDFRTQQWECTLFSFLLCQYTNQHMDTARDGYRDIYIIQTYCAEKTNFTVF